MYVSNIDFRCVNCTQSTQVIGNFFSENDQYIFSTLKVRNLLISHTLTGSGSIGFCEYGNELLGFLKARYFLICHMTQFLSKALTLKLSRQTDSWIIIWHVLRLVFILLFCDWKQNLDLEVQYKISLHDSTPLTRGVLKKNLLCESPNLIVLNVTELQSVYTYDT